MANDSGLFVSERYRSISEYLEKHQRATVEELAKNLFVSEATIRRDLTAMQKLGMIQRTHGGALFVEASQDVSIFVRMEKQSEEKEETASIALKHLPDFRSAFIDNSSSCFALAQRLNLSYKTIVTNGFKLALNLAERKNVEVIFLGGSVRYNSYATHGGVAMKMLEYLHFDVMLSGTACVRNNGAYERSLETADIKREAFAHSEKRFLLANKSKFNESFIYKVASLEEYEAIYTDASDEKIKALKDRGIKIFNH